MGRARRQREARDLRFNYIHNTYTDIPLTPPADAVRSPTFQSMRRLRDQGQLTPAQLRPFVVPRPVEELYDVQADPHELNNLANAPAYASELARLRGALGENSAKTGDTPIPTVRRPDHYDRETGNLPDGTAPPKAKPKGKGKP